MVFIAVLFLRTAKAKVSTCLTCLKTVSEKSMLLGLWAEFQRLKLHVFSVMEIFFLFSCQFVVSDSGDYTVYAVDPDILVDWSLVEQVVSNNIWYSTIVLIVVTIAY